jgi:hypothetical protein
MNYAVFILSHGRPDNVKTYDTLIRGGYTGKIYIVLDDLDQTASQYIERFGAAVIVFDKKKYAKETDSLDNFNAMNTVLYARNAVWDIAAGLGLEYFLVLDDDYSRIGYAYGPGYRYLIDGPKFCGDLGSLFASTFQYLETSKAHCIAWAQGGDFIGGQYSKAVASGVYSIRKAMNSFFLSTKRPFKFMATLNDDTTTYCSHGAKGLLFLTFTGMRVQQAQTQQAQGGLTDIYKRYGTYVKSFYTVMACPSFCKVAMMGNKDKRLHHLVAWGKAVPKIIKEAYKKQKGGRQ